MLRYILRKKKNMNLLTHVESYAEYYTNQEYGFFFWHRDENERFNLQNLSQQ